MIIIANPLWYVEYKKNNVCFMFLLRQSISNPAELFKQEHVKNNEEDYGRKKLNKYTETRIAGNYLHYLNDFKYFLILVVILTTITVSSMAQSARAVEYCDCIPTESKICPNECPDDTKQSDGVTSVILELWGMQSISALSSLLDPTQPGLVALHWVLSIGQIDLNCVLTLNWIVWNRTVYIIKMDLAWITDNYWCAIKPNQTRSNQMYRPLAESMHCKRWTAASK